MAMSDQCHAPLLQGERGDEVGRVGQSRGSAIVRTGERALTRGRISTAPRQGSCCLSSTPQDAKDAQQPPRGARRLGCVFEITHKKYDALVDSVYYFILHKEISKSIKIFQILFDYFTNI